MATHIALTTDLYKKAYNALKEGRPFDLINAYGEHKRFTPNTCIYNAKDLRFWFKFAYDMDETIIRVTTY